MGQCGALSRLCNPLCALCPASGLIFGTSDEAMLKRHISSFLPIGNRPITDLFDPISETKSAAFPRRGGMKVAKGERK